MTATTPVDQVSKMLVDVGYQRLESPLRIAGLSFEFPAVLVGAWQSPDLVLVADTALEPDKRVLSRVEGVARALDVLRSTRSLTLVLAGPRPISSVLEAMAKVCRVLPIGTAVGGTPQESLAGWLAVLTPIRLPLPGSDIADPFGELARHLQEENPFFAEMMKAAPGGSAAVQARLHELITNSLHDTQEPELP